MNMLPVLPASVMLFFSRTCTILPTKEMEGRGCYSILQGWFDPDPVNVLADRIIGVGSPYSVYAIPAAILLSGAGLLIQRRFLFWVASWFLGCILFVVLVLAIGLVRLQLGLFVEWELAYTPEMNTVRWSARVYDTWSHVVIAAYWILAAVLTTAYHAHILAVERDGASWLLRRRAEQALAAGRRRRRDRSPSAEVE